MQQLLLYVKLGQVLKFDYDQRLKLHVMKNNGLIKWKIINKTTSIIFLWDYSADLKKKLHMKLGTLQYWCVNMCYSPDQTKKKKKMEDQNDSMNYVKKKKKKNNGPYRRASIAWITFLSLLVVVSSWNSLKQQQQQHQPYLYI